MSRRQVEMAFKSTLDKLVNDLAAELSAAAPSANPVRAFGLDDATNERQWQAGTEHALAYQYTLLSEAPRHPLYDVTFLVGAKTTDDAGNYAMTDLITDLGDLFKSGDSFELFDYSEVEEGQDPGGQIGVLVIGSVDTGPQMFEKQSGIRLLQIEGKVIA